MRCPKCGFISFDHLATCLNCSKDISETATATRGTTYNAAPPMFLKFVQGGGPNENSFAKKSVHVDMAEDLDIVDPDLDILISDEAETEGGGISFDSDDIELKDEFGAADDGASFKISLDEETPDRTSLDDELAVDLSQFEEAGEEEVSGYRQEEKFTMDLPDELADISDLAPPPPPPLPQQQPAAKQSEKAFDEGVNFDMLDMDLKLDNLDFSLTDQDKGGKEEGIGGLSLDDIDLSTAPEEVKPVSAAPKPMPVAKPGEMDMDSDLDFDLDLGGLTLQKK
jgi:hypothetical protein